MMPSLRDSVPRVGLTVCTDCCVRFTGSEPAFRIAARSFAVSSVKLPVICPRPAVIGDCTTGFEMILWSTAIAIWFCGGWALTATRVAVANGGRALAVEHEVDHPLARSTGSNPTTTRWRS